MKAIFTGSRRWFDRGVVVRALGRLRRRYPENLVIRVGDCPTGVDAMVRSWCLRSAVELEVFQADWEKFGPRAGPLRNQKLVEVEPPVVCVGFLDADSKGTRDCLRRAVRRGILTFTYHRPRGRYLSPGELKEELQMTSPSKPTNQLRLL